MSGPTTAPDTGTTTSTDPGVAPPVTGSMPDAPIDPTATPTGDDMFVSTTIDPIPDAERDTALADPATNIDTIRGWGEDQIQAHITPAHIAAIPADKFADLPVSFLSALTAEQVGAFTDAETAKLSALQLTAMQPSALTSIDIDALRAIPPEIITSLNPDQVASLPLEGAINLTDAQMNAIEALGDPGPASNSLLQAVRERFVERLHGPGLDLTENVAFELSHWEPAEVQQLVSADVIATMNPSAIRQLPPSFIAGLGDDSIASLTSAQAGQLTAEQVFALSDEQVQMLMPEALKGFDAEQLNALSPSQISNMDDDQLAVIRTLPGGDNLIALAEGTGVIDASEMRALLGSDPAPDLSQLSLVELEACHPEAIAALGDKITELNTPLLSQLSPAQVAALTPEQVAVLCAEPDAGHFEALGPLVAHLSTPALQAIPDAMPASPVVDYAREVLRIRTEVAAEYQEKLEEGVPSGVDPDLANLGAYFIPSYKSYETTRNSDAAGGAVAAEVVLDIQTYSHQYKIPESINRPAPGEPPFTVMTQFREIRDVHIPIDGTPDEQERFNAEYKDSLQEFIDANNNWNMMMEHIHQVRHEIRMLGYQGTDIDDYAAEHRPEMQRLLQARLDYAVEVREAREKLATMLEDNGYDSDDLYLCPGDDPHILNANPPTHDYVDFTPMKSEEELEAEASEKVQRQVDALTPPEADFEMPTTQVIISPNTPGATVVPSTPAPDPDPARTDTVTAAEPELELENGQIYNVVVRHPDGVSLTGTPLGNAINRIEDLNSHARGVYGAERDTLYTEMSALISELAKNNPDVTIEVTPATASGREEPMPSGSGIPWSERVGVWAAARPVPAAPRSRDDDDTSI